MTEHIHDDEPDTGETVVRHLLATQCPQWADRPIEYLYSSGTDNAMWKVHVDDGPDLVVRLPRRPGSAAGVAKEAAVLEGLRKTEIVALVAVPVVRHVGHPDEVFPHRWMVLEWLDGIDAWAARTDLDDRPLDGLGQDLGRLVVAVGAVNDLALEPRTAPNRGGPLGPLLDRLDHWLTDPEWRAADLVDVGAVSRLVAQAREVVDEPVARGLVHGDLIPGNVLVGDGRLQAVIDWGGAGHGDLAQDLAPAWSILTAAERSTFRAITEADEATWIRGRAFELEHAVGGVLYYVPRRHPLGDVMARTLHRILTDE